MQINCFQNQTFFAVKIVIKFNPFQAFAVTHYLWIAPLECIIVTYLLYQYLGPAGVVGTVVLFIIMILQTIMGKKFGKLRYV